MATLDTFKQIVSVSRGLSRQERQDLLEHAGDFPATYRNAIVTVLRKFDAHCSVRERMLRDRLDEKLAEFERMLVADGVDVEVRNELIAKAKAQNSQFF